MATDSATDLQFTLRYKDEVTAELAGIGKGFSALGDTTKNAGAGTPAFSESTARLPGVLGKHTEAQGTAAAAARVLDSAHAKASSKIKEYVGSLGVAGQTLQALGPYGTAAAVAAAGSSTTSST